MNVNVKDEIIKVGASRAPQSVRMSLLDFVNGVHLQHVVIQHFATYLTGAALVPRVS